LNHPRLLNYPQARIGVKENSQRPKNYVIQFVFEKAIHT
jgi:hypothetical protein